MTIFATNGNNDGFTYNYYVRNMDNEYSGV